MTTETNTLIIEKIAALREMQSLIDKTIAQLHTELVSDVLIEMGIEI